MLTDFPRTVQQFLALLDSPSSVICFVTLEGPPENDRKNAVVKDLTAEFRTIFSKDLAFLSYNFASGAPEEVTQRMLDDLMATYIAYVKCQQTFVDVRFVSIPRYPLAPIPVPQLAPEKPVKGSAASAKAAQQQAQPPPPPNMTRALTTAYERAVLTQLDDFLTRASLPSYSAHFQHAAELLQNYPLPATLSAVLMHQPDPRPPEIFTMRVLAETTSLSYDTIFSVKMLQKFEETIGYSVGERRHVEQIPLDFVPNVMAPLLATCSQFKWMEFAGCILMVFFHGLPERLPIMELSEAFTLPLYHGFGRWLEGQPPFEPLLEPIPPETEIGVNCSSLDLFIGFKNDQTVKKTQTYFCESGLRVDTYPATIVNTLAESLSFLVSFRDASRFSFHISQRPMVPRPDEEEDLNVETTMKIRGVLGRGCEFFMDHTPFKVLFVILTPQARIEFDAIKGRTVMIGAAKESHRVITAKGELILFGPHPIIYRTDGSIQQYIKGVWHFINADGKAFVKKESGWCQNPEKDTTSETISTYFTNRKVTNRSDGVSFVEDGEDLTVVFPDHTKYSHKDQTFSHPSLPAVHILTDKIEIETSVFKAAFTAAKECSLELKNGECSLTFTEEIRHLHIHFGQSKNALTMVDLLSGTVVHVGARRLVYYLSDEWQWTLGRQLCSKKDLIQHFEDGDFVERIEAVTEMEREEIESIFSLGHKPRLFLVERLGSSFEVNELLAALDFQTLAEQSSNRISKRDESRVTLWFDTEPRTFREIRITNAIADQVKAEVFDGIERQLEAEKHRKMVLDSVEDPKWVQLEAEENEREEEISALLLRYKAHRPPPRSPKKP
jgi:hypothetical protein